MASRPLGTLTQHAEPALTNLAEWAVLRPRTSAGGRSGALLRVAVGRELRFLDATGSVLMNPVRMG